MPGLGDDVLIQSDFLDQAFDPLSFSPLFLFTFNPKINFKNILIFYYCNFLFELGTVDKELLGEGRGLRVFGFRVGRHVGSFGLRV